jgi:DNA polymerase
MTTSARIDFETISLADLRKVGASVYAAHSSTWIWCLVYAIDDEPAKLVVSFDTIPADLAAAIESGARIVAHHYQFERAIYRQHLVPLGWPEIADGQWDCTAFRARLARLPATLKELAATLATPHQKADGKVMQRINKLLKAGKAVPEELKQESYSYCMADVETLRDVDQALAEVPDAWRRIIAMDRELNDNGLPFDPSEVAKLIVVRDTENARLDAMFKALLGVDEATTGKDTLRSTRQVEKLRAKLASLGVDLPDLAKQTLEDWLATQGERDDLPVQLIRIRLESAHAADAKLDRLAAVGEVCGRVRDGFVLHGAHTGRWAGQGVQLQNLPRGTLDDPETVLASLLARADGLLAGTIDPMVDPGWGFSIKEALVSCLRALFKAPDGWMFVSVDLSQIEHRLLCWIADQVDKLGMYRCGEDVYLAEARDLNAEGNRPLGKLFTLSAGYGASGAALHKKAPWYGVAMTLAESDAYTAQWRDNNPAIVTFWHELTHYQDLAAEMQAGDAPIEFRGLRLWREPASGSLSQYLVVQLPSGRCLRYGDPGVDIDAFGKFSLQVRLPKGKKSQDVNLWHGRSTENVVSAMAADVLIAAMVRFHEDEIFLVGTVHDQVVALAPVEHAEEIRDYMVEVLSTPPEWAPDLPLAAEAFVNTRFTKPSRLATHAPLSPSASERWLNCPGSVAAEKLAPEAPESPYAAEGTVAHEIFAECLRKGCDPVDLTDDPWIHEPLRQALDVTRRIIDGRPFKVEFRLNALPGLAKIWGTADVIIFDEHGRVVAIVDLKFGVGVAVEISSPQLAIYGLLAAYQFSCDPAGLQVHVVQPRCPHPDGPHRFRQLFPHEMDDLVARLERAVEASEDLEAPRIGGTWCRFCAVRVACPEAQRRPAPAPLTGTIANPYTSGWMR